MFTGLVEETGKIISIEDLPGGKRISVAARKVMDDITRGSSIAVNGTCLTVESFDKGAFTIFAVPETLKLTNIGLLKKDSHINLERAVRADSRLGGHIVQGHIEAMARVDSIEKHENYWNVGIEYNSPYVIPKGSIALDGISLTIHSINAGKLFFQIIPETLAITNITEWSIGYWVNIETDYLVKAMDNIVKWNNQVK